MSKTDILGGLSVNIPGGSGAVLSGFSALSMAAPVAPSRYTVLDCWQEGSFDFYATLDGLLGTGTALHDYVFAVLEPFNVTGGSAALTLTPYNWYRLCFGTPCGGEFCAIMLTRRSILSRSLAPGVSSRGCLQLTSLRR